MKLDTPPKIALPELQCTVFPDLQGPLLRGPRGHVVSGFPEYFRKGPWEKSGIWYRCSTGTRAPKGNLNEFCRGARLQETPPNIGQEGWRSFSRVHSWSYHDGNGMSITVFPMASETSATDSIAWDRAEAQEVGFETQSLEFCRTSQIRSGARSEEQKDKSNAPGLECGLAQQCVQDEKNEFIHYVDQSPASGIDAIITLKDVI
ncbi:hypothetical protein EVAR_9785_1 [Eumeta japonica]|uniref:Uncharacterized protein n=1 Tax=Eumeta variegata TaxID=151549 RepID=A0A4C1U5R3_EUMVA|nr:hypothetical protein EVAR_9785_1 [Eumeta japonica]